MRGLSMYSGVGGLDLAAITAGVEIVAHCEADAFCRRVLAQRFPGVPCYASDTDVTAERLAADGLLPIDIVFGGPPCQPASGAGKRLGKSDPRWRWPQFLRIVSEVRPRILLAENPPGIASLFGGDAWADICGQCAALGYRIGWCVYGADAVGAPHRRDRLFLIGHLADDDGTGCGLRAGESIGQLWRGGTTVTGVAGAPELADSEQ